MSPALLISSPHLKEFPDNLRAIRNFFSINEPHALCLAFYACSVAVEVSLAHLLSGVTAMYGWVGHKKTIIMPTASTLTILGRQRKIILTRGKSIEESVPM